MKLSTAQNDRVAGVLLGRASEDSHCAGYKFSPVLADDVQLWMLGGGLGLEPGEWFGWGQTHVLRVEKPHEPMLDVFEITQFAFPHGQHAPPKRP